MRRPCLGALYLAGALGARGQELPERTCEFYLRNAYPSTYNIDLNVTCDLFFPSDGRAARRALALMTFREFPTNEIIAWVPEGHHIWEPTIHWPLRHAVADACEPHAYAEAVLATALLAERRDTDSRFKHYIAALAQVTLLDLRNIATFSRDHLRVLNVTRPDFVLNFESVLKCMEVSEQSLQVFDDVPATEGERLWAYGVVKSRGVRVHGRLALIPVLDLANHGADPNVQLESEAGVTETLPGSTMLRSRRALRAGEELVLSYGREAKNLELLATYGFVLAENPFGLHLPFNLDTSFRAVYDLEYDESDGGCSQVLMNPRLVKNAPLLLEPEAEKCLLERLWKYYDRHYSEIDVLNDQNIAMKALELLGLLCNQVLEGYRKIAPVLNRLQQHGQRVRDWLSLQVTHEAVDEMTFLQSCETMAQDRKDQVVALQRDDL